MKIKLGLVSALVTFVGGFWFTYAAPANANGAIPFFHGTACEAANLNQALQGIGWNQIGVTNNATIPLFVVCPIPRNSGETANASIVFGVGSIPCVVRGQDPAAGTFQSTMTTLVPGAGQTVAPNSVSTFSFNFDTVPTNVFWSIVCALDPGESIQGYSVFYTGV